MTHLGKKAEHDLSGADCDSEVRYAAHFADVEHEVQPVTTGRRLVVVYSMVTAVAAAGAAKPSAAATVRNAVAFHSVIVLLSLALPLLPPPPHTHIHTSLFV